MSNFHSHNLSPYSIHLKKRYPKSRNCLFLLNAGNWEKYIDTKEIWKSIFSQPFKTCFLKFTLDISHGGSGVSWSHQYLKSHTDSISEGWHLFATLKHNCLKFRKYITLEYNSTHFLWLILLLMTTLKFFENFTTNTDLQYGR